MCNHYEQLLRTKETMDAVTWKITFTHFYVEL